MRRSEKEIQDILNSLEGIRQAEARPYMYTRVMAKLQGEETNVWSQIGSFIARPLIAFACLAVILGTNVYFIIRSERTNTQATVNATAINSTAEILQSDNYTLTASYDF